MKLVHRKNICGIGLLTIGLLSLVTTGEPHSQTSPEAGLSTLCSGGETTVFSCEIGMKTVSLCLSSKIIEAGRVLYYRYGRLGQIPGLVYPTSDVTALKAFSFSNIGGPTWVVSFDNNNASYDVMSDLKQDKLPDSKFTGLGVTVNQGITKLRSCGSKNVVMNMQPLEEAGYFKQPMQQSIGFHFRVIKKTIAHGSTWTSTLEYPVIGDANLDTKIGAFINDCYDPEEEDGDHGECSKIVTAERVRADYLVLTFSTYKYESGTPHGMGNDDRKIYKRMGDEWVPVAKNSLISKTSQCQKQYISLVYRKIRPQLSDQQAQQYAQQLSDLFDDAEQVLTVNGVGFEYSAYELGQYAPPEPVLVPYEKLGACFDPQVEQDK